MNSEEVLGFKPKQNNYDCFMHTLTPDMAQYILDYHNKDNRPFYLSQLKALDKSLDVDGWCPDGGSMTFNTNGDLTEYQHRLDRIIENNLTVQVPVVVGVVPDTFIKTAPAKKRTPVDEMYRKDKTVVKDDEVTLRQFLSRKGGAKLNMKNAISMWKEYKKSVRKGRKISKDILKNPTYQSWGKEVLGFSALMNSIGQGETAKTLLKLLVNEIHGEHTTLTKDFRKFVKTEAGDALDMTNTEKSNSRFLLLCAAADKVNKKSDGKIELGLTKDKCVHERMKHNGVYRKFLIDPDDIGTLTHFL